MKVYIPVFFVLKNKNKLGLSKNLELCSKKEILVSEQDFVGEGLRDPLSYSDRPVRFMFRSSLLP